MSIKNAEEESPAASTGRSIVYVDGFNLFHGLREAKYRQYYWLDVRKLAECLVPREYRLSVVKYFTTRVSAIQGETQWRAKERDKSRLRQNVYLEALDAIDGMQIQYGSFLSKSAKCYECNATILSAEEKMTDVRIATSLVEDAFLDRFDLAIVVSGDSDLVPPIESVLKNFPEKKVFVAFPPCRRSSHLRKVATDSREIWEDTLRKSQMPEQVVKANGRVLTCPDRWRQPPPEVSTIPKGPVRLIADSPSRNGRDRRPR